jgi:pyruvate dehydrogenase E1 component
VILADGMRRMLTEQQDVYYYITLMNENYAHPEMPEGAAEGIVKGMYLLSDGGKAKKGAPRAALLGSGTILREVIAAAELLDKDFGVVCDVYSCPSFVELRRDGADAERFNRMNPEAKTPRKAWVAQCLEGRGASVAVAATDYVRAYGEQVRAYLPKGLHYTVLGTDGFGRSDTRANLRRFFEVDRFHIAHATVAALADEGLLMKAHVSKAMQLYGIDPGKPNPATV